MELVIRVNMDGAAFEDAPDEELARLFSELESKAACCYDKNSVRREFGCSQIRDLNGNICGSVRVEE